MHLHRPSLAFLLLLPSVLGEPIVDGYLNARAALITPAPRQAEEPKPCEQFNDALSFCESSISNFMDLSQQAQASCLCRGDPATGYRFDADVSSCLQISLDSGETSAESAARWIDFCCIYAPPPTPTQPPPASSSVIVQPSPPPSPVANLVACSTMCSVLTSCENKSPGFTDMNSATQAACLCYTSTKWVPDVWDSAVASCATEAAAASSMSIASVASEFEGFCHSVGPVGNPSVTPTPPPTSVPNHTGAIAGGVVGGTAGLVLIFGGVMFFLQRIAE